MHTCNIRIDHPIRMSSTNSSCTDSSAPYNISTTTRRPIICNQYMREMPMFCDGGPLISSNPYGRNREVTCAPPLSKRDEGAKDNEFISAFNVAIRLGYYNLYPHSKNSTLALAAAVIPPPNRPSYCLWISGGNWELGALRRNSLLPRYLGG